MAINFTFYPDLNRVPGIFVEMDPSQANTARTFQRSLVLGSMSSAGEATPLEPIETRSRAQVQLAAGRGSMLAQMAETYLDGDSFGDLWLLPYPDATAGIAATGSINIAGAATESGTLNVYIGGIRVRAGVRNGDTPLQVANALRAAINSNPDLAVTTGGGSGNPIALTAVNKGSAGNSIDIRLNYFGQMGNEFTPTGINVTITPMGGGTGNPDISPGLANLSDQTYDYIITPYTDTPNLNAMRDFLSDYQGRWGWQQMLYGGAFSAFRGTLGQCTAFGIGRNDQHMSITAYDDSPDPPWVWAANIGAHCASSLRVDPGLPLQYINTTLKAPPIASRWSIGERDTLLWSGLSTTRVGDDGTVIMERQRTTYQRNAAGADDDAYLDVETMFGLMYVARELRDYLLTRYARKKLVSNETQVMAGSNTVTPNMIRASTVACYQALEVAGYVQNYRNFSRDIVVENAGRGLVKILAPVDLVNQLRQIAVLLQFRKS